MNILLDPLPDAWNGYLIRTDFRIGIQIQQCMGDPDLSDYEKLSASLTLLYGAGAPRDIETAVDGLKWFMAGGSPEALEESTSSEPPVFDFDFDAGRIYSGFRRVYGIDLAHTRMHWFEFLSMMPDLSGTAFTDVMQIRTMDLSQVDASKRAEVAKVKKQFSIPTKFSEQDRAEIAAQMEEFAKLK